MSLGCLGCLSGPGKLGSRQDSYKKENATHLHAECSSPASADRASSDPGKTLIRRKCNICLSSDASPDRASSDHGKTHRKNMQHIFKLGCLGGPGKLGSRQDSHKKKMNMTRNTFQMKQTNEQDKFQNALLKQKETHSKQLTGNERKHHKRVKARTEQYQSEIQKITDDGNRKKAQKTKSFEKDFALLNKKQEIILKNLVGRKEELIHNLKADLTKEYKLGLEKGKDPFYKFGRIDAKLSELPDKSGYTVKVPISNHEADKVEMRAEKRQLRITMERRYEFQKNDKDSLDKVSKVESFVSKIPVKNIVDPKSITKEYSNGNLVFTIKNA